MFKRIKRALFALPVSLLSAWFEDTFLDVWEQKVLASPGKVDDYIALPLIRLVRFLINGVPLNEAVERVLSAASDGERELTELAMARVNEALAAEAAAEDPAVAPI